MRIEAEKQHIELTCQAQSGLLAEGDRERITQVIINIISNAIKYNKKDGSVRVTCEKEGDFACVTVADTGIGIPEADLPRIFDRFYRVDKARSRERGGTGLGLAIAKEIAMRHGGDIEIESEYGKGTVMKLKLPLTGEENEKN